MCLDLIRHFDKTPRDHAREFRHLESLGDMMPSDMLEHIYGLLLDPRVIYEIVFLDLLPPAARDAALQHSSLAAMAAAADKIVREESSAAAQAPPPTVSAIAADFEDLSVDGDISALSSDRRPQRTGDRPRPDARQRPPQRQRSPRTSKFLCFNHSHWGRNAHRCGDPSTCHMKDLVKPPPPRPSGNGRAGGQ